MVKNKLLKPLTGALAIGALIVILGAKGEKEGIEILYDISLAIFGSALLAWLVAKAEQYQDRKVIQRTVIRNILNTQREIKRILSEYCKTLDKWDAKDFRESAGKIYGYIEEFYAYNTTLKFENGKTDNFFEMEIVDIYRIFLHIESELRFIAMLLENNLRDDAYSKYKECIEADKSIVGSINNVLSKEYGKDFAKFESIGLL